MRVYERLRKQSLRAVGNTLANTGLGEKWFDFRQWGLHPRQIWTNQNHSSFVAGVRAALEAIEADMNKAYEDGLTDGAQFYNENVVGAFI